MGWTDSHLHGFEIGDRTFGMDGTDLEELNMLNEKRYTLDAVLATPFASSFTTTISVTVGVTASR